MAAVGEGKIYRFGAFEADARTGELRRGGFRVRLHMQPFQLLMLFLERPGELLSREEICRELWPNGTFVDFEQGLNSAVGRLREALGDRAASPRFIETLARRGYRWVAPVEVVGRAIAAPVANDTPVPEETSRDVIPEPEPDVRLGHGAALPRGGPRWLAQAEDLPQSPARVVAACFLGLQCMYLAFYVSSLANLGEIHDLMSVLPGAACWYAILVASAAALIPARLALVFGLAFQSPGFERKFLRMWPGLLLVDGAWALSPLLLLNHISFGLAMACVAPLVYAPFAERSLVLMWELRR